MLHQACCQSVIQPCSTARQRIQLHARYQPWSARSSMRRAAGKFPGGIEDIGVDMLRAPKMVLSDAERQRLDEAPDAQFYATPRMMQHADEAFIAALGRVFLSTLPLGASVLELCASHSSHLPPELQPRLMVGQGMNAQELAANTALHEWFVQDLNLQPLLMEQLDSSFEAVLLVNGLQYLTQPETVIAEACRVLRPGGICIIAFGPDCFKEKAWAGWLSRSMPERTQLLKRLLQANGFDEPMVLDAATHHQAQPGSHEQWPGLEMQVLVASKPRLWTAGAAPADTAGDVEMCAENVTAWFTKPGLAGLAEAASEHQQAARSNCTTEPCVTVQPPASSTSQPPHHSGNTHAGDTSRAAAVAGANPAVAAAAGEAGAGAGAGAGATPSAAAVVNERLLEQWHAAYDSLVADAVDLGIPRSVIPGVQQGASPAELQEAVQHLQAMMASFLSSGL